MCIQNGKETRISLDQWLIEVASTIAKRSSWPGTKVGCVAVKDGRILATGYNGTPRKWGGPEDRDNSAVFSHSEENAIVNAARYGVSLEGCTFYVTLSPCIACARMMANVGAAAVVYAELWEGHGGVIEDALRFAGVSLRKAERDGNGK